MSLVNLTEPVGLNAIFNPIVYTFQRKDGTFTIVVNDGGLARLNAGGLDALNKGDIITVVGSVYNGVYEVYASTAISVTIDTAYISSDSGWIIADVLFPNYYALTEIAYYNTDTSSWGVLAYSRNSPNLTGLVTVDISGFLKGVINKDDDFGFDAINDCSHNQYCTVKIRIKERWTGSEDDSPAPSYSGYYSSVIGINAAFSLQEGSGDMTSYGMGWGGLAKFLSGFEEPRWWADYPFDLSIHWSGIGLESEVDVYRRVERFGGTMGKGQADLYDELTAWCSQKITRMLVDVEYSSATTKFLKVSIYEVDITVSPQADPPDIQLTEKIQLNMDERGTRCYENPMYLKWLNKLGGFDYWLFGDDHEMKYIVSGAEEITKHIDDWGTDETKEDGYKKMARDTYILYAGKLTIGEVGGLKGLLHSPRVQILTNQAEWLAGKDDTPPVEATWMTVTIKTNSFKLGMMSQNKFAFTIEMLKPIKNIQIL